MGNKKSLRYLISKYAVIELIYTFCIIVIFYLGLNVLINAGIVYPANYADMEIKKIESRFQSDDWKPEEIPFYYDFLYLENGKTIKNTIDKKYHDELSEALKSGRASTDELIGSNVFKLYKKEGKQLVLRYKISIIPTNERVYKLFDNFELLYIFFFLITWFIGFVLLLIHSSNLLKKEINKIAIANEKINKMDLDYNRDYSIYKEIDGVLNSIDVLAKNLKKSLGEQWDMQVRQKEMVEEITHDIRTPITLIKGNLELLKEENSELSQERFSDISNGIARLENYVEKLKRFSYTMKGEIESVSNEVISYWIEVMSSICRHNGFNLEVVKSECSNIHLDKDEIAVALQNIITNSIEYSKKSSTISVEFRDEISDFVLIVRDKGAGFDQDLLPILTEKFISSKIKDKNYKHGLGLWVVKNIVDANNGKLYLENYSEGAEVKMIFNKKI